LTNGSSRELVLDALCEVLDLVQGVVLDAVQHRWIYPGCMYTNIRCLWYNEWACRSALGECLGSAMDMIWSNMDGPRMQPGVTWETGALAGREPNKSCRWMTWSHRKLVNNASWTDASPGHLMMSQNLLHIWVMTDVTVMMVALTAHMNIWQTTIRCHNLVYILTFWGLWNSYFFVYDLIWIMKKEWMKKNYMKVMIHEFLVANWQCDFSQYQFQRTIRFHKLVNILIFWFQ